MQNSKFNKKEAYKPVTSGQKNLNKHLIKSTYGWQIRTLKDVTRY